MSDTERQGSAALSMSDLAGIAARRPLAVNAARRALIEAGSGEWRQGCVITSHDTEKAHLTATLIEDVPALVNAVSALLADLARARDAATRVREVALGRFTEEYLTSIPDRLASPETRLRRGMLAALDADAAAGGEQT